VTVAAGYRRPAFRRPSYRDYHDDDYDYWGRHRDDYHDSQERGSYRGYRRGRDSSHHSSEDSSEDSHSASHEDSHHESNEEHAEDDHVYRFQMVEDDYGPYIYHDDEGYAHGFEIDLMMEVCEHAHKKCYFTMDKATNCWYNEDGHEYPGVGLLAGWYDGCFGFFPTAERMNSFNFTKSFTENPWFSLYYKKEAGLMEEDDHHLDGHKIGFVRGWAGSQTCLDHLSGYSGNHIGEYTAVHFDDLKHMLQALEDGEVDAILAPKALGLEDKGMSHTDPYFHCSTDGTAIMTRYGAEVLGWWNQAYDEMVHNNQIHSLCKRASKRHGHRGEIHCHH
jgi:hypothetical protein